MRGYSKLAPTCYCSSITKFSADFLPRISIVFPSLSLSLSRLFMPLFVVEIVLLSSLSLSLQIPYFFASAVHNVNENFDGGVRERLISI